MSRLLHRISERMARLLEREGKLERDREDGGLILDGFDEEVINHLQGSSIIDSRPLIFLVFIDSSAA